MKPRADRNMAVTPEQLENRDHAPADPAAVIDPSTELAALHARIERARHVKPSSPKERHCINCFTFGRDAAIRAILGEE